MKKKLLSILLTLSMIFTLAPVTTSWAAGDYEGKIVILHSNDVHGATKWHYKTTSSRRKVIKGLKKGKKYQIKVRAKKTVGKVTYYGAWPSVKTTAKIK